MSRAGFGIAATGLLRRASYLWKASGPTTVKTETKRAVSFGRTAGFVAALVFAVAAPGWAQSRAGGLAIRVAGHVSGARPISHAAARVATPLNQNFAPLYGVPGNGFGYQHLVAVGGSTRGRVGAATRDRRSFITPIFGFGLPYYYAFDTGYPYNYGVANEQAPAAPLTPAIPDAGESALHRVGSSSRANTGSPSPAGAGTVDPGATRRAGGYGRSVHDLGRSADLHHPRRAAPLISSLGAGCRRDAPDEQCEWHFGRPSGLDSSRSPAVQLRWRSSQMPG
jgi:hypothetical protein